MCSNGDWCSKGTGYPNSLNHLMAKQRRPLGLPCGWQVTLPFSFMAKMKSTVVWTVRRSFSSVSSRSKTTKPICVSDVMIGVTNAWLKIGLLLPSIVRVFIRYFWSKYTLTYGFNSAASSAGLSKVPFMIEITAFPVSGGSMHVPLMHLKAFCVIQERQKHKLMSCPVLRCCHRFGKCDKSPAAGDMALSDR